jgi:hypothetical protein
MSQSSNTLMMYRDVSKSSTLDSDSVYAESLAF